MGDVSEGRGILVGFEETDNLDPGAHLSQNAQAKNLRRVEHVVSVVGRVSGPRQRHVSEQITTTLGSRDDRAAPA